MDPGHLKSPSTSWKEPPMVSPPVSARQLHHSTIDAIPEARRNQSGSIVSMQLPHSKREVPSHSPVPAPTGELTAVDMVIALVHAVRNTLPLCPPPPEADRQMYGYAQARPQGWGVSGFGPGSAPPIPDEQLLTRERVTQVATFDIGKAGVSMPLRVQSTAPAIFMRILHWCRITPEDFLSDWVAAIGDLSTAEQRSKGKSGSSFIFSSRQMFIIKTLREEEANSLKGLLPSYYAHLLQNPNTLFNQHLGLFSCERPLPDGSPGKKRFFTVMPNIHPTAPGITIETTFDLKGSTYQRFASAREKEAAEPVLKDNDFLEARRKFAIGALDYSLLQAQLQRDTRWLLDHNLMDYSFLIKRVQVDGNFAEMNRLSYRYHRDDPDSQSSCFPLPLGVRVLRSAGGGSGGNVLYFVGLIDMLQDYNFRRKVAHTIKTRIGGAAVTAPSTVAPDVYADRFRDFILNRCFTRQKEVQWSFFLNPKQTAGERSKLHRDEYIAPGDVVGRTQKDTLTLDLLNPGIKSICVVTEARPTRHASEQMDEGRVSVFSNRAHADSPDRMDRMSPRKEGPSPVPGGYTAEAARRSSYTPLPGLNSTIPQGKNSPPPLARPRTSTLVVSPRPGPDGTISPLGFHRTGSPVSPGRTTRIETSRFGQDMKASESYTGLDALDIGNDDSGRGSDIPPQLRRLGRPTRAFSTRQQTAPLAKLLREEGGEQLYSYTVCSGKVKVNVVGPVAVGDLLVPSGRQDGTATALPISCQIPPYAFGVVDSIPEPGGNASSFSVDPEYSKFTVVDATVEERFLYDPPLQFERLEVEEFGDVDSLYPITQGVWRGMSEGVCKSLTRALVLNASELSMFRLNVPVGQQVGDWATVDWVQGLLTHGNVAAPVRCAEGPEVVASCLQSALRLRQTRFRVHLERAIAETRRGQPTTPNITVEEPLALGDRTQNTHTTSSSNLRHRQRSATDGPATASAAASAFAANLALREGATSPMPRHTPRPAAAPPSLMDDTRSDSEILSNADKSFGGWIRGWISTGWPGLKSTKNSSMPVQNQSFRSFRSGHGSFRREALTQVFPCTVSKLFEQRGLFRAILLYLTVPSMCCCSRVCRLWEQQWRAPELWSEVLVKYNSGCGEEDKEPSSEILKRECPAGRREVRPFSNGERWRELFGLSEPPYLYLRRRLFQLANRAAQYEVLFDRVQDPRRTLVDLSIHRRVKLDTVVPGDTQFTWEMDRAFQMLCPSLAPQWNRSVCTICFSHPYYLWQVSSTGQTKGRVAAVREAPEANAAVTGSLECNTEIPGLLLQNDWVQLSDGSGFVPRERGGLVLRRGALLKGPPEGTPAPTRASLLQLRRAVLRWLAHVGRSGYARVSWEGNELTVRYQWRGGADAVLQSFDRDGGVVKLGFLCYRYASVDRGRGFQMCRKVSTWSEACHRLFDCLPGAASNVLRTHHPKSAQIPEEEDRFCRQVMAELHQTRGLVTQSLQHLLFPTGEGQAIASRATDAIETPREAVVIDAQPPRARGRTLAPQKGDPYKEALLRDGKSVEVYELKDSENIRLAGQVFPLFIVSSTTVIAVTEVNQQRGRMSRPAAEKDPSGYLCVEGYHGLETYLLFPLRLVRCPADRLRRLVLSVDMVLEAESTTETYYANWLPGMWTPDGEGVIVEDELWVCKQLDHLRDQFLEVLRGERDCVDALSLDAQQSIIQAVETPISPGERAASVSRPASGEHAPRPPALSVIPQIPEIPTTASADPLPSPEGSAPGAYMTPRPDSPSGTSSRVQRSQPSHPRASPSPEQYPFQTPRQHFDK
eukprot:Hpha_TRINITY_DN16822_c0_g21::TRINITY_DN16822_c0_g21_i1::g.149845::m.149845